MTQTAEIIRLGIEARRAYERKEWAAAGERRLDVADLAGPDMLGPMGAFANREFDHLGGDVFTAVHALHDLTEAALEALRATMRGDRIDDAAMWTLEANADAEQHNALGAARALLARQVLDNLATLLPAAPAAVIPLRREAM